jgi:hypothetical protein
MTSKAVVPTNSDGVEPDELYSSTRISPSLTWSNGSMLFTPLLNSSWKTKLIRAPPDSSFKERSFVFPSMADRKPAQNSLIVDSTTEPGFVSPIGPPRAASSVWYFDSCCPILALMSGSVFRIWCMRIWHQPRSSFKDSRYSAFSLAKGYRSTGPLTHSLSGFRRTSSHCLEPR